LLSKTPPVPFNNPSLSPQRWSSASPAREILLDSDDWETPPFFEIFLSFPFSSNYFAFPTEDNVIAAFLSPESLLPIPPSKAFRNSDVGFPSSCCSRLDHSSPSLSPRNFFFLFLFPPSSWGSADKRSFIPLLERGMVILFSPPQEATLLIHLLAYFDRINSPLRHQADNRGGGNPPPHPLAQTPHVPPRLQSGGVEKGPPFSVRDPDGSPHSFFFNRQGGSLVGPPLF